MLGTASHTCSFDGEELNLSCKMSKSGEYGPDRRLAGIVKLTLMVTSGRQTTLMDLELMPDLRLLEILGPCDAVTVKNADKVAIICQTVRKSFILVLKQFCYAFRKEVDQNAFDN